MPGVSMIWPGFGPGWPVAVEAESPTTEAGWPDEPEAGSLDEPGAGGLDAVGEESPVVGLGKSNISAKVVV